MKFYKKILILFILIIVSIIWLLFISNSIISNNTYENIDNIANNNEMTAVDNITVVSGYWKVNSKYDHDTYDNWFKNTLNINQRYIFFCDEKDFDYIKSFRNDYETEFINHSLDNFYSSRYATNDWIHFINSPSKEVSMIWHEKMNMLKMAKDHDIVQHVNPNEFYIWIDSGIASYRDKSPPTTRLNLKDINSLPHDKVCHSAEFIHNDCMLDGSKSNRDIFAATCIIMHRDIIDKIHYLYYNLLDECNRMHVEEGYCGQEQRIFTDMKDKYPDLFYKMSKQVVFNETIRKNCQK